jgi:hypothetical protein
MCKTLGYSVFVSTFEESKDRLRALYTEGSRIFTSLHIAEEVDATYAARAEAMCAYLKEIGYGIIADVSKRTVDLFGGTDIVAIAERLGVEALRIDYGFSEDEMEAIARRFPVCLNASTVPLKTAERIARSAVRAVAMHNYYPRPETGLDRPFFDAANRRFADLGMEVYSFVPGGDAADGPRSRGLRGPLHLGLPTLEDHRDASPYAAFVDTVRSHRVDGVFVGDGLIGEADAALVRTFLETGVLSIPVEFDPRYAYLEGKIFTVRPDSPFRVARLAESREYATAGIEIEPYNTVERKAGSVTMDNRDYLRYSGEIQIVREDLEADAKVNVIGKVPSNYRLLLKHLRNGERFLVAAARGSVAQGSVAQSSVARGSVARGSVARGSV